MNRQSATVQMKARNPVCDSERREVSSSSSPLYTPANSKASTHAHMSLSQKNPNPIIIVRFNNFNGFKNMTVALLLWRSRVTCLRRPTGANALQTAKCCKRRKHNDKKNKPTNIKKTGKRREMKMLRSQKLSRNKYLQTPPKHRQERNAANTLCKGSAPCQWQFSSFELTLRMYLFVYLPTYVGQKSA